MIRSYRQRNQPFHSAVGPVGVGGVFIEEWERGGGVAGGSYASLRGLYGLPPDWTHIMPMGDSGPSAAPAVSAEQQMCWLALPAQADTDPNQYRWNAVLRSLPVPAAGDYSYQIDASYIVGLYDELRRSSAPEPGDVKVGSIGIILGNDSLLAPGWLDPFYFSNTIAEEAESATTPEIWDDAQTINNQSIASAEMASLVYLTLLLTREGPDTRILTYVGNAGVDKILIGDQTLEGITCTRIGFAVRTEEPQGGAPGMAVSGWCDYIRARTAQEGEVGTVAFGQTGGRNW